MEEARILIYGDPHLSSKPYGAHINYPKESLRCFQQITAYVEHLGVTHLIGLGDFSYGRFHSLEYRNAVMEELIKQNRFTKNQYYQIKGNHDVAGYGDTERDFCIKWGFMKPSENLTIGPLHLTMVDYQAHNTTPVNFGTAPSDVNVILAHDFLKFQNTALPKYGNPLILDDFERWYGAHYIISGHIHNQHVFAGNMRCMGHPDRQVIVQYPGAMSRPSYIRGHMDLSGKLVYLTVSSKGEFQYQIIDVALPPLEEVFNTVAQEEKYLKKLEQENRIDISDIIASMDAHERNIGNPEDIIAAMEVDARYKAKAIDYLKAGLA